MWKVSKSLTSSSLPIVKVRKQSFTSFTGGKEVYWPGPRSGAWQHWSENWRPDSRRHGSTVTVTCPASERHVPAMMSVRIRTVRSRLRVWKPCPESRTDLCTGCRNLTRNAEAFMHRRLRPDSDLGEGYAQGAETWLRFRTDLCTEGRSMTQIQDILMHRVQKHAPSSRQIYARGAETWTKLRAELCTVCIIFPQIQGRELRNKLAQINHKL